MLCLGATIKNSGRHLQRTLEDHHKIYLHWSLPSATNSVGPGISVPH